MAKDRRLTYHPGLYLGESISEKKLDKIKKKLRTKPLSANVFLIAAAHNPHDLLEIFDARQMAQHYYEDYEVYVIGIASDYQEAVAMVEQIVQECLQRRGDCALREYLLC